MKFSRARSRNKFVTKRAYGRVKDGKPLYMVTPGYTDLNTTSVYVKAYINQSRKSYERFEIRRIQNRIIVSCSRGCWPFKKIVRV